MRRFRVIRGGLSPSTPDLAGRNPDREPEADPALARRLRSLYAPPGEGYWDNLESTIMAAVRAGRAAPATAAEWCQTLARWARPGLAAAAVLLGVVGGVYVQSRGARSDALYRAMLEEPTSPIEPIDEELARATDSWGGGDRAADREERAAADLLTDGVKRRGHVELTIGVSPARDEGSTDSAAVRDSVRARRGATFRHP